MSSQGHQDSFRQDSSRSGHGTFGGYDDGDDDLTGLLEDYDFGSDRWALDRFLSLMSLLGDDDDDIDSHVDSGMRHMPGSRYTRSFGSARHKRATAKVSASGRHTTRVDSAKVSASGSDVDFYATLREFTLLNATALLTDQPGMLPPQLLTPLSLRDGFALLDSIAVRRASFRHRLRFGFLRGSKLLRQSCCILNVDFLQSKRWWMNFDRSAPHVDRLASFSRFSWRSEWRDPARQRASLQALHPP